MKRLTTLLLALALLLGCVCVFASAEDPAAELQAMKPVGDVNGDGTINAKDVTVLRRYLAGGYGITVDSRAADVSGDGALSAKDITVLRRYLAGGYGVELGVYFTEPELSYNGVVTGGQLYTDLGAPSFGEYTLTVTVDGVAQNAAPFAAKIVEGNADALTPEGSYTEAVKDESAKTVALTISLLFADGGVQYETTTLAFNGDAAKYRRLGRAEQLADCVLVDWSADGVEFVADCGGDISLTAWAERESQLASGARSNHLRFRVFVDGVMSEPIQFEQPDGVLTKLAVTDVPAGRHTIRIVKDNGVDYGIHKLLSVTLNADPASIRASQPRPKLLEVIGASTAAGAGILPTPDDGYSQGTNNTSCITLSFGYLVAEDLGMDITTCVKGSLGIVVQAGRFNAFNLPELYEYQNRYRDARSIQLGEIPGPAEPYAFPRKADAVILMINENDKSVSSEEWIPATVDFIARIREINDNAPVFFLYYGGSAHYKNGDIPYILENDPALTGLGIRSNDSGSGGHASAAAHRGWADQLLELMRPVLS